MLDVKYIIKNPEKIRKILEARFMDTSLVDRFLLEYDKFKKIKIEVDKLRAEKNKINVNIAKYRKEKKDIKKLIENLKEVTEKIEKLEVELKSTEENINKLLYNFPNLLLEDVPIGGEEDFKIIRQFGETKKITKHHQDILPSSLLDTKKASEVSGSRFFYLKGKLAELNLALQKFALDKLVEKGYIAIIPPYMIKRKPYEGVVSFEAFEDALYKIEKEDLYLIATSEHSIAALHMDEILNEKDLPLKYVGISPCFRKEAGAHGKDTKGIFRIHQFNKIEQFIFCKPEESKILHEEIISNAEEIIKALEIPYRVVILASGDTSKVSAKTYDIQAWFPGQNKYREIVSASNCLDFQARRLKIRYYKNGNRIFVHTLNSTALAIERTLACLVENFYDENKNVIKIPKALWPYLRFKEIEL
ncbi:MAG: serine--tRNA ligase [Candidatus Pacearchaeota archaeon]